MSQMKEIKLGPTSQANCENSINTVIISEPLPVALIGLVGYTQTPRRLCALTHIQVNHLSTEVKRRFYKNWFQNKS